MEDTGELQCAALNFVQYHTTINVTMTDILRLILRMRPDRIFHAITYHLDSALFLVFQDLLTLPLGFVPCPF
ncbi:ATPase, T2SS/T4P/T4SS family [Escherichia coli]|uniref:ATPase, T2SS/T4P/T4SS family n=1 Tax=Escherichia coli TaxID=562 RepID=UPI003EDF7C29